MEESRDPHLRLGGVIFRREFSLLLLYSDLMATTHFQGDKVQTSGELPTIGSKAPEFVVTDAHLADLKNEDFAGKNIVLNIFPSIDTGVCAMSVRKFNQQASDLDNTVVLCVSYDLPFALDRFCAAEGIDGVITASAFRSSFGADYGVLQEDGPLAGLLARSVVVINAEGIVIYTQLVEEITNEPDYDAAIASLA